MPFEPFQPPVPPPERRDTPASLLIAAGIAHLEQGSRYWCKRALIDGDARCALGSMPGCGAIGINNGPLMAAIACRRIEQAHRQRDLFIHAPPAADPAEARTVDMFAEPEAA